MSLADKLKAPTAPATSDEKKTAAAIEAKAAHVLALEQGLRVFKKQRLNMVVLNNGARVRPTQEGYFIAINKELEDQLTHYATKMYGQVEEVKDTK